MEGKVKKPARLVELHLTCFSMSNALKTGGQIF